MAALLLFSASMVGDLFRIRREAMAYRRELGLTAESAKWDRQLVSLSKHVDAGEYQQALSDMDSAMKKGADQESGMWIKRAAILVLLDRSDEALKSLDQADTLDDSHSESALIRAQIYTARNEDIPACTVLENFLNRYPDDVACSAALGRSNTMRATMKRRCPCIGQPFGTPATAVMIRSAISTVPRAKCCWETTRRP